MLSISRTNGRFYCIVRTGGRFSCVKIHNTSEPSPCAALDKISKLYRCDIMLEALDRNYGICGGKDKPHSELKRSGGVCR